VRVDLQWTAWSVLTTVSALGACTASRPERRDSATAVSRPLTHPAAEAGSERFELQTLQGELLPATIAEVRNDTHEGCGDTTYSAAYVLRERHWTYHEATGNDCHSAAQHQEQTDSGTIERWKDSVRFLYSSGGAITGEFKGDSLIIEDGGPREVYRRVHP
jgi:hypothetical protein